MQAGLLREWVEIQSDEVTPGKYGDKERAWVTKFRKRARVQFKSGDRVEDGRDTFFTQVITVTIRNQKGIDRTMRVVWNAEKYRILSADHDKLQGTLVMRCELINE